MMTPYETGILILLAIYPPCAVVILYHILRALWGIRALLVVKPSREDLLIEQARKDLANFLREDES